MTLLITLFMSVVTTVIWYIYPQSNMRIGTLALIYWGASLMWLVDAVAEYIDLGEEYFTPASADMLNDTYLGLSVAVLALVIWLIILLVKGPEHRVKSALLKYKK